jgi:subtilisin family serine protease
MKIFRSLLSVCCLGCLLGLAMIGKSLLYDGSLSASNHNIAALNSASKLRKPDREHLAKALANGDAEALVLIASVPGENEAVAREIDRLGGTVRFREDSVDYISAKAPTAQIEAIARLGSIQAINIENPRVFPYDTSSGGEVTDKVMTSKPPQRVIPTPDRNTPAENPYLPVRDIGAPQFIAAHPTFDGRGVTIGVIDFLPDLLLPELQTAMTLDGKPTRKIVDVLTAADPMDGETPYHVKMSDEVSAAGGMFTYKGVHYTAPGDGTYRIGLYVRSKRSHVVLWDEKAKTVWVDTNENKSFVDEKAMMDYNARYDFSVFGKDDPATPVRESMAFVVKTYPKTEYVAIFVMGANHGTMVSSAAAGKAFFGGKMNGAAPEAQIAVFARTLGVWMYAQLEPFILAAKHPKIDIISASNAFHMPFDDGHSTFGVILNRLVEKYKKPIFISASNTGVTLNSVSELANGSNVIAVGGYLHKESWLALFGVEATRNDYVTNMSSRGPSEDGGFKPDIIAPMHGISAWPATGPSRMLTDAYKLPPGYATGGGTSYACPIAAGSAALLISAARQSGVSYDAERIRWALKTSARYLPDYGANEQGAGLIDIPAAWELLRRAPTPVTITSRAPVNTVYSRYFGEPDRGRGIYERHGWAAGQTGERTIIFTRTSGQLQPITYRVRWVGNDGSFSSPAEISLPLNKPVRLPVAISLKTEGVHSAILNLVDTKTSYIVYQVMNTVVAAAQFTAESEYTIKRAGEVEWLGYESYFINVPAGVSAIKFDMELSGGEAKLEIHDSVNGDACISRPLLPGITSGMIMYQGTGQVKQTFARPVPGVWEINVQNGDRRLPGRLGARRPPLHFSLRASIIRVEAISPAISIGASAVEVIGRQTITFTNRFSRFSGGIAPTSLGSAFTAQPVFTEGAAPQIYEIEALPGTKMLSAKLTKSSDKSADLDLYLYDCTGKEAVLRDYSNGAGIDEMVSIPNPTAGKWKVVIDPVSVPAGKTTAEYQDVFTNPVYGMLKSGEAHAERRGGQKWSEIVVVNAGMVPADNRSLVGIVEVEGGRTETVGVKTAQFYQGTPAQEHVALGTAVIKIKKIKTAHATSQ